MSLATDPPEQLYNQGLANMKAGNTGEAIRKFEPRVTITRVLTEGVRATVLPMRREKASK